MKSITKAFTLAETLITLAIIGVVAAMVIPSIMQKTQNQEYVTVLKKFYVEANQALAQTALDNCSLGDIKCFNSAADMQMAIASQFKKVKDCGISTTDNCWSTYNTNYDGTGSNYDYDANSSYKFLTTNGMSVGFGIIYADCSNHLSTDPSSPLYNRCGDLGVDVNGLKGPNRVGRDVFFFRITSNKYPILYPFGGQDDDVSWNGVSHVCQAGNTGGGRCAGRIMEEGWQMNY